MKTKISIKNRFTGSVLFEFETENNTIKKTVEKAMKEKINLRGSDLSDSDLSGSDLSNSNLRGSDLRDSDLRGSDLSGSYLRGSDLRGSENKNLAYLPIFCKWSNGYKADKIKIGCKEKTIKEWEDFFKSEEEFETKRNTEGFKQIQAVFEAYKSYINFLNS